MGLLNTINSIPWGILLIACLTLGLAPFQPPHVVEKLQMLSRGQLIRPMDWFDLIMHGSPWVLLMLKIIAGLVVKNAD